MRGAIIPALALGLPLLWPGHLAAQPAQPAALDPALLAQTLDKAAKLPRLRALIVARHGKSLVERVFRGPGLDVPVNVKSVSKTVISALVGAAIDRGVLEGPDQPIAPLLPDQLPKRTDPRLARVTIGHLLSMRSGLERTSGRNYGRWVQSRNWVRFVLARPLVEEPGTAMQYSTGNSHLLSAVLTRAAGRSTLELARAWLAAPLGFALQPWQTDPQGIYLGGNNMRLSPRALLRIGEMYRNGGRHRGRQVISRAWVRASWVPRAVSPYSGDGYGYGWFITAACGHPVFYARGFGGQFIYVVPTLELTIVLTSTTTTRTRIGGYRTALKSLVGSGIIAAARRADAGALAPAPADCML
ncbi:MAG: beta-lactamase family protein [Alphaproteobacteria bacterium]|nr:beta-lactamase family protein [Alphaproteobacteria bacterium]